MSGVKVGAAMVAATRVVAVCKQFQIRIPGLAVANAVLFIIQAIDTGTTLIYLPQQIAQAFYDLVCRDLRPLR